MNAEAYSYIQLLLAALIAAGGGAGFIKILSFGVGLWKGRQKAKLIEAVEVRRLATEAKHIDDETMERALWRLLDERKAEIDALRIRIFELEQSHSMSRPTVLKIYAAMRKIREQIDIVSDTVREAELSPAEHEALINEINILRGRVAELEQILP